jgi:hypothetical protein
MFWTLEIPFKTGFTVVIVVAAAVMALAVVKATLEVYSSIFSGNKVL